MEFPKITNSDMHNETSNKNMTENPNKLSTTTSALMTKLEDDISSAEDYAGFYNAFDKLVQEENGYFVNPTTFKINDVYAYLGFKDDANYYKELLTKLNKAKISIAPRFLKSITSKSGSSVTFVQIPGTSNGELQDYRKLYENVPIQNKKQAYLDVQKLLKLGIINNKILTRNAFEVVPIENKIVISDWGAVSSVSSNVDKANILNIARETLFGTN